MSGDETRVLPCLFWVHPDKGRTASRVFSHNRMNQRKHDEYAQYFSLTKQQKEDNCLSKIFQTKPNRSNSPSLCTIDTQVVIEISNVYGNLKKLGLCICEALSHMHGTMKTAFVGVAINFYVNWVHVSVNSSHRWSEWSNNLRSKHVNITSTNLEA